MQYPGSRWRTVPSEASWIREAACVVSDASPYSATQQVPSFGFTHGDCGHQSSSCSESAVGVVAEHRVSHMPPGPRPWH